MISKVPRPTTSVFRVKNLIIYLKKYLRIIPNFYKQQWRTISLHASNMNSIYFRPLA